jgi:O-antigen biosynthesis protein
MGHKRFSIIVTNYNGCDLLRQYFGSVIDAASSCSDVAEIIVADDSSTDESVEYLRQTYPAVRVFTSDVNHGFAVNANNAVRRSVGEVVVLLNNDLRVEKGFLNPLLPHFYDDRVFAVCMKSHLIRNQNIDETLASGKYNKGFVYATHPGINGHPRLSEDACTNFVACGGCSAFDRDKWLQLGGFDPVYHPFYWEDTDISYRAWKRGWIVLYEPRSRVYHWLHGTFEKIESMERIDTTVWRNQYLFFWKNISDYSLLIRHAIWLMGLIPISALLMRRGRWRPMWRGFIRAVPLLPQVLKSRRTLRNAPRLLTDRQILERSANQDYISDASLP